MNVDFPAPLSPSTHVTSPALTLVVMFCRAMMLPKYLLTLVELEQVDVRHCRLLRHASRPPA